MSKQSEAKAKQGYTTDMMICGNCVHFKSVQEPMQGYPQFTVERNKRCGIGGFAVKKTATCNEFEWDKYVLGRV
jgi:hypothetical protein